MQKSNLLDHAIILEQATAERWRAVGSILQSAGWALSRPPSLICLSVGAALLLMSATDPLSPEKTSVARGPSSDAVRQISPYTTLGRNEPLDVTITGSVSPVPR
jgi:hypothetical protein